MNYEYKFTVFTSLFNGASTLHRVYNSLKMQTFRDFEWLIVDDGSTDNAGKLVEQWQREAEFPIRYLYQENHGKPITFNRAVKLAKGELFLNLDADDALVPETLECFWDHWNNIPDHLRHNFTGVNCLCQDELGNPVGDKYPLDVMDSDELEMRHKYKVRGEKYGFHRTEVLKQFPFMELPGIRLIPEGIIWNAIASQYKKRFINRPLRVYYSATPRLDQLTTQMKKKPQQLALGRWLYHKENLNNYVHWMRYDPWDFLKSAANYVRFSFHLRIGFWQAMQELTNRKAKLLYIIALPVGLLVTIIDKRRV